MIELALLYRILHLVDHVATALHRLAAVATPLYELLAGRAVQAASETGPVVARSQSSGSARVIRVRRRGHGCAPVELAYGEDVSPSARRAA